MNDTHVLDLIFGSLLVGLLLGWVYIFPFIICYDIGKNKAKESEELL